MMAERQLPVPLGVFHAKRSDVWGWYLVDPVIGDDLVGERIAAWKAANAETNKPAWRRVIFWVVFAIVVVAVGIVIPFVFWSAKEVGTYALMLLAGLVAGAAAGWGLDSLFTDTAPEHDDPHVTPLDLNLTDWVRTARSRDDMWQLNRAVGEAVVLMELETLAPANRLRDDVRQTIDRALEEQLALVDELAARVGYAVPRGGLATSFDD